MKKILNWLYCRILAHRGAVAVSDVHALTLMESSPRWHSDCCPNCKWAVVWYR